MTDGEMDLVDGYEDLPADMQEKVKRAIEQGHVDDVDWKHVCACSIRSVFLLTVNRTLHRTSLELRVFDRCPLRRRYASSPYVNRSSKARPHPLCSSFGVLY